MQTRTGYRRCVWLLISVAVMASATPPSAAQQVRYRLSVLPTPTGFSECGPRSINGSGLVVGQTTPWGSGYPVAWPFGSPWVLPGTRGAAMGVSDLGVVVGRVGTESAPRPARWATPNASSYDDLGTLGGPYGVAAAINGAGQIAGSSQTPTGQWRATLWDGGNITALEPLAGKVHSYGLAINASGQVAGVSTDMWGGGRRATLWTGGVAIDLGDLGGGQSEARAINDAGQVVGWSTTPSGNSYAFIYSGGTMQQLPLPLGSGNTVAQAINAAGDVAGSFYGVAGSPPYYGSHGCLWRNGTVVSLECVVVDEFGIPATNFQIYDTLGTNAVGQVVGYGTVGSSPLLTILLTRSEPAAASDSYATDEDTELVIGAPGVLANDTGAGAPLSAVLVSPPAHGLLNLRADGSFTYVPDADWHGTDTFRYRATGGSTQSAEATVTITVAEVNDAPVVNMDREAVATDEGAMASQTGSVSDADGDAVTLTPSIGSISMSDDGTWEWQLKAVDGPADSQQVVITARDSRGLTSTIAFDLIVRNVEPTMGPVSSTAEPVQVGTGITASAPFADAGVLDTHTVEWDWGDGSVSAGSAVSDGGSGLATGSHTYTVPGVYTIRATLRDSDGASVSGTYSYAVVYDPSGGFVTGGGWIISPAGAYLADPALTGKATFGFNAKYQKGRSVPDGQTQFQFRVADLAFHSNSYHWLVVAGARAQFRGIGTINGTGNHRFTITAIDGQRPGGGGLDKFRIRIQDDATGVLVYDNEVDMPEGGDPSTVLGGGSIVIHE